MPTIDEELNEQVLQSLRAGRDDLSIARPVDFQFVFPTREEADAFASAVAARGLKVTVADVAEGPAPGLPWDVHVEIQMKPELYAISSFERDLGAVAASSNGRPDGWYCERLTRDR